MLLTQGGGKQKEKGKVERGRARKGEECAHEKL
jgi:hypothetical protein